MPYIGRSENFGVRSVFHFLASNGDTSVSGADADGKNLSFADGNYIDVYLNGVRLKHNEDYVTTTANTVGSIAAMNANDEVNVVVYDKFGVADTVSASSGGTFSGNITHNGTVTFGSTVSGLDVNGTELILDADADTSITADTDDQIDIKIGGTDEVTLSSSGIVINEGSNDRDFRVETDGATNTFFVDGGRDAVGIGTAAPCPAGLGIVTGGGAKGVMLTRNDGSGNPTDGQGFGSFGFKGIMDGSNTIAAAEAAIEAIASENHSGTTAGTDLAFYVKPSGTGPGSSPTERVRIHSGGVVSFNNGIELGSGLDATAANTLDDYEEGTFVVAFSSGSGTVTIDDSFKTGVYTKIGSVVTFTLHARVASVSGNSGSLLITGLPFTTPNDNKYRHTIGVMAYFTLTGMTNLELPFAYLSSNSTNLNLAITNTNNLQALNSNRVQASSEFYITGSYQVTV